MALPKFMLDPSERITRAFEGVMRFAKLERALAALCILIPVFLIWFEDGPIKPSISHYYDMEESVVFYFPLTVVAMLFVVNGLVKFQKAYNIFLGVMLTGVILINLDYSYFIHAFFAIGFFGGNAVVILKYSSKKDLWFKTFLFVGIMLSMAGCYFFNWFTLFFAEWLSLGIIALHYILESQKRSKPLNSASGEREVVEG